MGKRYELLSSSSGIHQIRALVDMPEYDVKAGDLGGFIMKEENLPQVGTAWVKEPARIWGESVVYQGLVCGDSTIFGDSSVSCIEIRDSDIKRCSIKGDVEINKSRLEQVTIEQGGLIDESTLIAVVIKSYSIFQRTIMKTVKERAYFHKTVDFMDVSLNLNRGIFYAPCKWREVRNDSTGLLAIVQKTDTKLDSVRIGKECNHIQFGMNGDSESSKIEMHCFGGGAVSIDAPFFLCGDVSIEGNVTIKGNLTLRKSTLKDFASVDWVGEVVGCHLSEMASLYGNRDDIVRNLTLSGEKRYEKRYETA